MAVLGVGFSDKYGKKNQRTHAIPKKLHVIGMHFTFEKIYHVRMLSLS